MRGAGCTWNDITDRKIDGAVERTRSRPIPSGQITLTQAVIWMILQISLAGLILLSYNLNSIILGLSSLFLVVILSFSQKDLPGGHKYSLDSHLIGEYFCFLWLIPEALAGQLLLYTLLEFFGPCFTIQFTLIRTVKMICL